MSIHYLNGKFVEEKDLLISPRDLGFSRGYAVFDFFVTYQGGRPFMLERHIDRFFNSAGCIELSFPWSKEEVTRCVMETLARNADGTEKGVKIGLTGGVSDSLMPSPDAATLMILVDDRHYFPSEMYENGVKAITVEHARYAPEAKTNNYIEGVRQVQNAERVGAIEPVYYDHRQVFEGAISNVFALIDGQLVTSKTNILPGITREVLLDILKLEVPVLAKDFTIDELRSASELFFAGSNKEVMPITRVDGNLVGHGTPGPITKEAMRQFREFTLGDRW